MVDLIGTEGEGERHLFRHLILTRSKWLVSMKSSCHVAVVQVPFLSTDLCIFNSCILVSF